MATVDEILDSRVGSTVGFDGVGMPRIFRVKMDASTDDPVRTLQNHANGIVYQSSHPWNVNALATQYSILERESPKRYLIEVEYVILTTLERGFRIVPGWTARFRGYAESEPMLQEVLDDPPIPPGRGSARQIGTPEYTFAGAATPTHTYSDTIAGATVTLVQTGAVVPHDVNRLRPAATMTLEKTRNDWVPSTFGQALSFIGKTNRQTFFGADPGHLQFVDLAIDPTGAEIEVLPGGRIRRWGSHPFVWNITLVFVWTFLDRAVLDLVNTYPSDTGATFLVTKIGDTTPSITSLQVAQTADMNALLGLFA